VKLTLLQNEKAEEWQTAQQEYGTWHSRKVPLRSGKTSQLKLLEPEKATAEDVMTRLGAEPVGGELRFHNVHV